MLTGLYTSTGSSDRYLQMFKFWVISNFQGLPLFGDALLPEHVFRSFDVLHLSRYIGVSCLLVHLPTSQHIDLHIVLITIITDVFASTIIGNRT